MTLPSLLTTGSLRNKTLFITGASRGIGKAIALRAAQDGARIAVVGKTSEPHPKLAGTVHGTVEEIKALGGEALACVADVRFEDQIQAAVAQTVARFGGIDILVNNASAIQLSTTPHTPAKRFDLMHQVNVRGTFLCSQSCLPHLERGNNPHILMLSPPLNLKAEWFSSHLAYSLSKFGMSLCVLGLAEELRASKIAVNALWPRTTIATAAVENLLGGEQLMRRSRKPSIVADAAHLLLTQPSTFTGQFCLDEEVLRASGVSDFTAYSVTHGSELFPDLFVE